jgi:MscS family membrane protein
MTTPHATPYTRSALLLATLAATVLLAGPVRSQDQADTTTTTLPQVDDESEGFESPRSAMRGFLRAGRDGDWQRAGSYLDLRGRKKEEGAKLARQLKTVLDRKLWVDIDGLSPAVEGNTKDAELQNRDLVGAFTKWNGDWVKIIVERLPAADGAREWKIARTTVQQVPALWLEFGDGPLAERLPQPFFDIRFLDVPMWQWIALLLLALVAGAIAWLITAPLIHLLRAIARRTTTSRDDKLLGIVSGPVRLALFATVMLLGSAPIQLSVPVQRTLRGILGGLIIVAATWLLIRIIDAGTRSMERRYTARGLTAARSVVTLARRTLTTFVVLLTLLAVLQNLGFNVTGLVAGLGIGGLAVALAAQKSLEHFFGGLSLVADQPIRVGDFCRFGDRMGTVEDIGLRSTRIRTLDRTLVTLPNAEFSCMQIENFARRDRMLVHTTLGLRYETTPDQLRWLLVELKALLLAHPKVSPDPARVRLVGFGASSLDVELFFFINTVDFEEFTAVREDLFLRIMDVVAASGTGLAFPAQIEYSAHDIGIDLERQRAAEAQVAAWRAERTLQEVPNNRAAELAASVAWPPTASSGR